MSRSAHEGIPDARWINRELSIAEVAAKLDCRPGAFGKLHCWHPENHKNGDRSPSVGIHVKANRVKCFGCDSKLMSVVDLVVDKLGCNVPEAFRWLDERFKIPRIPKGKHLKETERPRFPVGQEKPMELIVRSGIWARFSPSTQRIFPVLLCFAECDQKRRFSVTMSYRALMRYSGVKSYNSVSEAVKELRALRLLESLPGGGETVPVRKTLDYVLTPYSDEFQELANAVAGEHRAEIEEERQWREQARSDRVKQFQAQKIPRHDGT